MINNKKRFKRVYIEITNICNLKCKFCPQNSRKPESMDLCSFENILKQIKPYTDYIYLHVKGEPLIHSGLKAILDCAEKYKLSVNITTNGTLLKEKAEILKSSNSIRQINISVHSIEQNCEPSENEQYLDGQLKNILEAADKINNETNCYISYRLWNMENIKEIEKNANALKLIGKRYNITDIIKKAKTNTAIELGNNKYINQDTIYEWPSTKKAVVSTKGTCYGLIGQIAILVDGTVVPCCLDQEGDIKLGNIFQNTIEEILNTKLAKEIYEGFRQNKLIHPLCQRCGFREKKRR